MPKSKHQVPGRVRATYEFIKANRDRWNRMELSATEAFRLGLIACDESGIHGARHYGFGTLWMPWQRRGDFAELLRRLREEQWFISKVKPWDDQQLGDAGAHYRRQRHNRRAGIWGCPVRC